MSYPDAYPCCAYCGCRPAYREAGPSPWLCEFCRHRCDLIHQLTRYARKRRIDMVRKFPGLHARLKYVAAKG